MKTYKHNKEIEKNIQVKHQSENILNDSQPSREIQSKAKSTSIQNNRNLESNCFSQKSKEKTNRENSKENETDTDKAMFPLVVGVVFSSYLGVIST